MKAPPISSPILWRSLVAFAAVVLILGFYGSASQALDHSKIGYAEVVLDEPRGGAIQGEMVLLRFRAIIHGLSALDELRQPALADLDWKQLGRDHTFEATYEGFAARGYERDIAIYPQRSGKITIDSFVYHLTMVDADNRRVEVDVVSPPVSLDVRPVPAAVGTNWLPAKSLTVTDSWDKRPDRLAFGETVRRTVTIEAAGIGPEHLPPPPLMRASGVISFAGPVERTVQLTPQGPVARAVYRWDIRPVSRNPAVLPAFPIHWFDTVNRYPREAVIPEQRVSLAAAFGAAAESDVVKHTQPSLGYVAAAGFGGLLWGLAVLFLLLTNRRAASARRLLAAALAPLKIAARADDPHAFRNNLSALVRSEPRVARLCAQDPEIGTHIAALDAHLFSAGDRPRPSLALLVKRIASGLRRQDDTTASGTGGLVPLDGTISPRQPNVVLRHLQAYRLASLFRRSKMRIF